VLVFAAEISSWVKVAEFGFLVKNEPHVLGEAMLGA